MSSIAIQKAERIIANNTRSDELNLEGLGLEDLKPLVPALAQMTRLRRLKLARNKLTALPEDLTTARGVEFLDLSGNPIAGLSAIVHGLYCLTNLKHLYVDTVTPDEEETIIAEIASLLSINGTPLSDDVDEAEMRGNASPSNNAGIGATSSMGNNNISAAAAAAAAASSLSPHRGGGGALPPIAAKSRWDDADTAQVQRVYQVANAVSGRSTNRGEFEDYTKSVLAHLQQLIQTEEDPLKREAQILTAKKILFEYCFCEVVRGSQRFDPVLAQSLETLQDTYAQLLSSYERLTKNIFEEKARRVEEMRVEMQKPIQEIESLMAQLEAKEGHGVDKAAFDQERRKYVEEIGWLRTENEKLQTKLRQSELARQSSAGNFSASRALTTGGGSSSPFGNNGPDGSVSRPPPAIGSKVLTQRQLRDCIEEIYASKSKYDIKCAETHLPRETMEQHMYTHLNQKYGLKHIILEWATAIIQGIKKFSAEDNDVAVFGKILRNEIDEEFRFVQRQLKETVHELLRVYIKGKLPLKSDEEINNIVKKKTTGTLLEEEWIDIVKYMYNNEDAVSLIMRVRDILKQKDQPRRRQAVRRGAPADDKPPQIGYAEFLRTLLDFQLEGHERFLSRFVRVYKQHDTDRNGIVNEHEFRMILKGIDPSKSEEEVAGLLDLIDPHNNQLISFSECVTFLSTELVKLMKEDA